MKFLEIISRNDYYIYNAEKLVRMVVREMDDSVCEICFLLEGEDANERWDGVVVPLTEKAILSVGITYFTFDEMKNRMCLFVREIERKIMGVLLHDYGYFSIETNEGEFRIRCEKG